MLGVDLTAPYHQHTHLLKNLACNVCLIGRVHTYSFEEKEIQARYWTWPHTDTHTHFIPIVQRIPSWWKRMDKELGKILVTTAKMSRKKANLSVWKQDAKCFSLVLRKGRTTAAYNNLP